MHWLSQPAFRRVFLPHTRDWWDTRPLPSSERFRVRQGLAILTSLQPLIEDVEAELTRLSTVEPWASPTVFLVQMPGIGVLSAIVLLSALGDGSRFPSLVGYSRQCTSVGGSGATHRIGRITKEGPRDVRTTMVEAAWVAVETTAQLEDRVRRWGVKFRPALTLTTAAIADEPRRR